MNVKKSRAHQKAIGMLKDSLRRTSARTRQDFDVAVAVSGGADSLALAVTAAKVLGRGNFSTITINYGLQPDSAEIAENAAKQCLELGAREADVVEVSIQGSANLEAKARTARYEVFRKLIVQHESQHTHTLVVLLAHTLDDQAETVLLGLARGSGTSALFGMSEFTGDYLRPFLQLHRKETEEICLVNGLSYWLDPTNSCSKDDDLSRVPTRSVVRNILLPEFEQIFPGVRKNLTRTATILSADSGYLEKVALKEYRSCTYTRENMHELDIDRLKLLPDALRWRVIRLWCKEHADFEQLTLERVLQIDKRLIQLDGLGGRNIQLPGEFIVRRTEWNTLQIFRQLQSRCPLAPEKH